MVKCGAVANRLSALGIKVMRSSIIPVLWTAVAGTLAAAQEAKPLKAGDTIPGSFQVLMATGPRADMFHSPVDEYDLNPAVLIFIRDADDMKGPVLDFLKKVDAAIAAHPQARIGGCAIVMNDGGYRKGLEAPIDTTLKVPDIELTKATVAKDEKLKVLREAGKNLKFVTLGLGNVGGPEKYAIAKDADITVLFYHQQIVVSNSAFKKADFTDMAADKIVSAINAKAVEVEKFLTRKK
jgi:hypothetical protein